MPSGCSPEPWFQWFQEPKPSYLWERYLGGVGDYIGDIQLDLTQNIQDTCTYCPLMLRPWLPFVSAGLEPALTFLVSFLLSFLEATFVSSSGPFVSIGASGVTEPQLGKLWTEDLGGTTRAKTHICVWQRKSGMVSHCLPLPNVWNVVMESKEQKKF